MPQPHFHLVYAPADEQRGKGDRVLSLFQSNDPEEILLQVHRHPESIAMELDAQTVDEAEAELRQLGFIHGF